jgi:hypothetical protein
MAVDGAVRYFLPSRRAASASIKRSSQLASERPSCASRSAAAFTDGLSTDEEYRASGDGLSPHGGERHSPDDKQAWLRPADPRLQMPPKQPGPQNWPKSSEEDSKASRAVDRLRPLPAPCRRTPGNVEDRFCGRAVPAALPRQNRCHCISGICARPVLRIAFSFDCPAGVRPLGGWVIAGHNNPFAARQIAKVRSYPLANGETERASIARML